MGWGLWQGMLLWLWYGLQLKFGWIEDSGVVLKIVQGLERLGSWVELEMGMEFGIRF